MFENPSSFLVLAVVLLAGLFFGWGAKRLRLPSVTGQILAGFLIGPSVLGFFDEEHLDELAPLTTFALGLMAVSVGSHLNLRLLKNAFRRLSYLMVAEAVAVPILVVSAILLIAPETPTPTALLLCTLAISTAPATVVAIVREMRAKGVFVKTLVAAVALNNITCIFLFELVRTALHGVLAEGGVNWVETFTAPLIQLAAAALLGVLGATVMHLVTQLMVRRERGTTAALVTLLVMIGVSDQLAISPLLSCAFLGIFQANFSPRVEQVAHSFFADLQPAILAAFFTLAGALLHADQIPAAGLVAGTFVLARIVGKCLAARLALGFAGAPDKVRRQLGLALTPQAGVAVGLVLVLEADPTFAALRELIVTVTLAAVTLNEVIGPILTRRALVQAGEADKDRARVLDFLEEHNIEVDWPAGSKEETIEKLVDFLIRSHRLPPTSRKWLLESVMERESQITTCMGDGIAIPHGVWEGGERMVGVMALNRDGLDWPTPDGQPVRCVVLLATPPDQRDRHLAVLSAIAKSIGMKKAVQDSLYHALSPAHAYEILHGDEAEEFNEFLEEDESARA